MLCRAALELPLPPLWEVAPQLKKLRRSVLRLPKGSSHSRGSSVSSDDSASSWEAAGGREFFWVVEGVRVNTHPSAGYVLGLLEDGNTLGGAKPK